MPGSKKKKPAGESFNRLVGIMTKLRGGEGCPWDKKQTHISLIKYLIEETYETADAVRKKNSSALCEELGDVLLQVVFHAVIASETEEFTIDDVICGLNQKLISRHPHVFGSAPKAAHADEVLKNWQKIKSSQKKRASALDGIPAVMPPLERAELIQNRAVSAGFAWEGSSSVKKRISEKVSVTEKALQKGKGARIRAEFGDLLFFILFWANKSGINAAEALHGANEKFTRRFKAMEMRPFHGAAKKSTTAK